MLVGRRGSRSSEEEVGGVGRRGGTKGRGEESEFGAEATRTRYHKRIGSEGEAVDSGETGTGHAEFGN